MHGPHPKPLIGIALMIAAMLVMPFLDVVAKFLGQQNVPIVEIVWGRLAFGTLTLSWLGAIGAGLTVGLKRGNVLLSLIVLPLAMPLIIFGAGATDRAIAGSSTSGALYLLAALSVLTCTLAPFAATAALRITLE